MFSFQLLQEAEGWGERFGELSEQKKTFESSKGDLEEALKGKEGQLKVSTVCGCNPHPSFFRLLLWPHFACKIDQWLPGEQVRFPGRSRAKAFSPLSCLPSSCAGWLGPATASLRGGGRGRGFFWNQRSHCRFSWFFFVWKNLEYFCVGERRFLKVQSKDGLSRMFICCVF